MSQTRHSRFSFIDALEQVVTLRAFFHLLRSASPVLVVLMFGTAAYGQGTMDFSGAQTLMGTFKSCSILVEVKFCSNESVQIKAKNGEDAAQREAKDLAKGVHLTNVWSDASLADVGYVICIDCKVPAKGQASRSDFGTRIAEQMLELRQRVCGCAAFHGPMLHSLPCSLDNKGKIQHDCGAPQASLCCDTQPVRCRLPFYRSGGRPHGNSLSITKQLVQDFISIAK